MTIEEKLEQTTAQYKAERVKLKSLYYIKIGVLMATHDCDVYEAFKKISSPIGEAVEEVYNEVEKEILL